MRLFAAIVPPDNVLDEVARVVRSVNDPEPAGRETHRRLLQRLPGRGYRGAHAAGREPLATATTRRPAATTHELATPAVHQLHIPITGFGNVTMGDSVKLVNALRDEVAKWRRARLVFAGGAALEFPGDQSVWVKIEGDVDGLNAIGRGVPQAVQRVGYFVDRRQFRPWMSLGTITDTTTAPYLERLIGALQRFRGEPWVADGVSMMKWLPDAEHNGEFEEMEWMPLA